MEILKEIALLILNALNTPAGIAILVSILTIILNAILKSKPEWAKYEGTILQAVKMAEKAIPADTENKGLKRLDFALEIVIKAFEELKGRKPSTKEIHSLKEGINIKHNEMTA